MFAQMQLPFIRRIDAARTIKAIHSDVLGLVQPLLEKLQ